MFDTTELLSYALFLFLTYVYLPYTLFKFGAERVIDLGRRRDFTQLEEIIAGFVPTFFLHLQAIALYFTHNALFGVWFTIDFSVVASMFGRDRGAVSDYLYIGHWVGFLIYLADIWGLSIANGYWFGRATLYVSLNDPAAVHGLDKVWTEDNARASVWSGRWSWIRQRFGWSIPVKSGSPDTKRAARSGRLPWWLRPPWWLWYQFFDESIVPLFPWVAKPPLLRVETTDHRIFYGRFVRYEKTTDGRLDAIRLSGAQRYRWEEKRPAYEAKEVKSLDVGTLYLKWSQISDLVVVPAEGLIEVDEQLKRHRSLLSLQSQDTPL